MNKNKNSATPHGMGPRKSHDRIVWMNAGCLSILGLPRIMIIVWITSIMQRNLLRFLLFINVQTNSNMLN